MMYKQLIRPILFRFDPERVHHFAISLCRRIQSSPLLLPLVDTCYHHKDARLRQTVFGKSFENPIGLAAGFDKNAELIPFFHALGFGYTEVGAVTAKPSHGNPQPRLFRLPADRALLNRMGLNNDGVAEITKRIARTNRPYPIGINVAKSHDASIVGDEAVDDILSTLKQIELQADYITLNISCPNTADGRTFEEADSLSALLSLIQKQGKCAPILLKLSPDLSESQVLAIVEVACSFAVDGFVVSNTTRSRNGLRTAGGEVEKHGSGGVSGVPIAKRSTELIHRLYQLTGGNIPIIGVGGIFSAQDAIDKIAAGASLLQIYTGLIYEGPSIAQKINQGLCRFLDAKHLSSIAEGVGLAHR